MQHDAFDTIHDCLVDVDLNPSDDRIEWVYASLSDHVRILANQWGWSDTEVREAVRAFILIKKRVL